MEHADGNSISNLPDLHCNHGNGKQLFNVVVESSEVKMKVKGKAHDLGLPGKDAAFVSFAKTSPTTNGGKLDPTLVEKAGVTASTETR